MNIFAKPSLSLFRYDQENLNAFLESFETIAEKHEQRRQKLKRDVSTHLERTQIDCRMEIGRFGKWATSTGISYHFWREARRDYDERVPAALHRNALHHQTQDRQLDAGLQRRRTGSLRVCSRSLWIIQWRTSTIVGKSQRREGSSCVTLAYRMSSVGLFSLRFWFWTSKSSKLKISKQKTPMVTHHLLPFRVTVPRES